LELAYRGVRLSSLLKFYSELHLHMPHFKPGVHRTLDVVRQVIIPLSREAGTSMATILMEGRPTLPDRMVTHGWSNLFRNLMASIVADALDEDEYESLAYLMDTDFQQVQDWISQRGVDERTYWVCIFSVSQHASICNANPSQESDPVLGTVYEVCTCKTPKHWNLTEPLLNGKSVGCEMNKFEDMMGYISVVSRDFAQVIAVDTEFQLFNRAWCVAEIAKAHRIGLHQHLKLLSFESLKLHAESLRHLKIESMRATRKEDVDDILAGIPDKSEFNSKVQQLIFDKLVPMWQDIDTREQMAMVGRIARWQHLAETKGNTTMFAFRNIARE